MAMFTSALDRARKQGAFVSANYLHALEETYRFLASVTIDPGNDQGYTIMPARIGHKNVILEFQDGELLLKPTYQNEAGRFYYQEGDLILVKTWEKYRVEEDFPELKSAQDDNPSELFSALWIALAFPGWEEPKYTWGWKIEDVDPFSHKYVTPGRIT